MKHTENEIIIKSKKVLEVLQGEFYEEKNVEGTWYSDDKPPLRGEQKGEVIPLWTVSINEPVFDSTTFLVISDETGEPLYFQTKHKVYEIFKNEEGKYYLNTENLDN